MFPPSAARHFGVILLGRVKTQNDKLPGKRSTHSTPSFIATLPVLCITHHRRGVDLVRRDARRKLASPEQEALLLDALVTQSSEEALLDKEALEIACDAVKDREWLAMRLRARGLTFKQVGEELGVSTERARQVYFSGLKKARKRLKAKLPSNEQLEAAIRAENARSAARWKRIYERDMAEMRERERAAADAIYPPPSTSWQPSQDVGDKYFERYGTFYQ
jgi:hypothetical protein